MRGRLGERTDIIDRPATARRGTYRILYVDDDPVDREAVKRCVERDRLPFQVVTCADVASARQLLAAGGFDAVLVDRLLDGESGTDLLTDDSPIPMIVLTGHTELEHAVEAMRLGAADYLIKDPKRLYLDLLGTTLKNSIDRWQLREHRAQNEQLRMANFELDKFSSLVAAALTNPVELIEHHCRLLRSSTNLESDPFAKSCLGTTMRSAQRMRALVVGLHRYARDCQARPKLEILDSASLLARSVTNLNELIEPRQATVRYGDLPHILADEGQMQILFDHLIRNAIEFVEEGKAPEVRVKATFEEDRWRFEIRDNARPIPEGQVDKIFDVFCRLKPLVNSSGIGIGLAMCRRIVRSHGGRIHATGSENGNSFVFDLPPVPD